MGKFLRINDPDELDSVHDLIHDCYFDVDDIAFDPLTSVLSFRFRRLPKRHPWWRDFLTTSKMSPTIECYLRIYDVESYSINDKERVGTYDFNVLHYESSRRCITVLTGTPIDIQIVVRNFGISVEETDNAFESRSG